MTPEQQAALVNNVAADRTRPPVTRAVVLRYKIGCAVLNVEMNKTGASLINVSPIVISTEKELMDVVRCTIELLHDAADLRGTHNILVLEDILKNLADGEMHLCFDDLPF